jgi:ribosomal protein S12 methylthiotransferase accessory factor
VSEPLLISYSRGTDRLVSPRETLERIRPALSACGITRCASVTHLDELGLPVYCAVRPTGMVLQVSNGKGTDCESSQASALMESIELYHAENPEDERLLYATLAALKQTGEAIIEPHEVNGFDHGYFGPEFPIEWTCGEDLHSGEPVWAPACAVYFGRLPSRITTTSNGLASGNHLVEASLHSLYELIERDAVSGLSDLGQVRIREEGKIIRHATIGNSYLREMVEGVEGHDTKVVMFWMKSCVSVHTFGAFFLSRAAIAAVTTLNVGWGTHFDCNIAAFRAVTEAAQSRLVYIHGAREDGLAKPVYAAERVDLSPGYRFFDKLEANTDWSTLPSYPSISDDRNLTSRYQRLVDELGQAGQRLVRFDLSKPGIDVPVVKILAPGLRFNQAMY